MLSFHGNQFPSIVVQETLRLLELKQLALFCRLLETARCLSSGYQRVYFPFIRHFLSAQVPVTWEPAVQLAVLCLCSFLRRSPTRAVTMLWYLPCFPLYLSQCLAPSRCSIVLVKGGEQMDHGSSDIVTWSEPY